MSSISVPFKEAVAAAMVDRDAARMAGERTEPRQGKWTCVMDYRLSPFCWTRLQSASQRGPVLSLEMSSETSEYAWDKVEWAGDFKRVTLFREQECNAAPRREMIRRLRSALDEHRPAAVAVVGWSFNWSLAALAWCLENRVPAILLSDSTADSNRRVWWKEWTKRRLVPLYSAAVVAGSPQRDYVAGFGMSRDRIFRGWDVVDNDYYALRADEARRNAAALRARLGLPERYFVSVSRFVEKKNTTGLIEAYARYRASAGRDAWKLVLIGDGPLRPEVLALRDRLNLGDDLVLPGFQQYPDLPAYYALGSAFVLASTHEETWGLVVNEAMACGLPVIVSNRCGCATDLVAHGRNGFTFDPFDQTALTDRLTLMASERVQRSEMGWLSREIIARWSPATWAENLQKAVETATSSALPGYGMFNRLLLRLLINR